MKKLLFIGLAATAMLAGCSNDETVEMAQPAAIGFESFVDKSTRATESDDITLTNLGSIECMVGEVIFKSLTSRL